MADLVVDLVALDDFGNRLDRIKSDLDTSHHTIDSYDGDYGSTRVRDAMHRFEGHWHDGRKHVEDTAGTLAAMAHESVNTYTKADAELAAKLRAAEQARTTTVTTAATR